MGSIITISTFNKADSKIYFPKNSHPDPQKKRIVPAGEAAQR